MIKRKSFITNRIYITRLIDRQQILPNQFYALLVGRVDENEVDRTRKNDTEMLDQAFQILVFLKLICDVDGCTFKRYQMKMFCTHILSHEFQMHLNF